MKKNLKRFLTIPLALTLGFGILTGCFSSEPTVTETPTTQQPTTTTPTTTTEAPPAVEVTEFVPDLSEHVTLNLSVFFNSSVHMRYTVDGGVHRPQSEYHAANGRIYREGDFKPVWEELQERLNFTIEDVTPPDAVNIRAQFLSWQAQNFNGVDIMVGQASDIVTEGVVNGTFLDLSEYLEFMPHFSQFLAENSVVETSIRAGNGAIYYAPYFDGFDDVERMMIARVDWIEMLLDSEDLVFNTDRVIEPHYTAFHPEVMNMQLTTVTNDGSRVQTIQMSQTENIITVQNNLDVMNGYNLVMALRDHIDTVYEGVFEQRSHLFAGQDAAYNADELIALMRAVYANSTLLTGQSEHAAVPLFPRSHQMGRVFQLLSFTEIWGVKGQENAFNYFYLDDNGVIRDARFDMEMMAALDKLNQIYREGLILQNFDRADATDGLPGNDHRARLLTANLGFLTYDYNQTTTVFNSLADTIEGFNLTPILPAMADWEGNGEFFQYTGSWRTVKSDGWAILASVANDEARLMRALALFDYLYSPSGNRLMSYGPEAWIDGYFEYRGRMVPRLSEAAHRELQELAGGNYTNFYRMWLGATFPIGYVKEQGMEHQTVHPLGQVGLERILRSVDLGVMRHPVVDIDNAPSYFLTMLPSTFATTAAEETLLLEQVAILPSLFRAGNNNDDRIIFVDYILHGFGGTMPNGETLMSQQELRDWLWYDLNGYLSMEIYNAAYQRMLEFRRNR
ncbi:MAG: hypothetical protein FWD82_02415 [Defluviitaleaceae bacterium]|nr:hypothetical protein [Defluviitaleaceae bacterium]